MTGARRLAVLAPATLLALVGLLVVEVLLARRGAMLAGGRLDLDGRVGPAGGSALRVVWLGDSTAAGVGVEEAGDSLPWQVAGRLDRPVDLTVLAVSGDTVGDVLGDQVPAVGGLDPDVVYVSIGANDVTHVTTRDEFAERYRRVLDALPDEASVVLLGVPDMGAVPRLAQPLRAIAGFRGRELDEVVREVADERGATYVPIGPATGPAFRADPARMFAADDYHPSATGYVRWADAVEAAAPDPAP